MPGLGHVILPARRSIRTRLLLLALVPLGIVLPAIMAALAYWEGNYFDQLLATKVRSDLGVAHGYYERVTEGVGRSVESLANSERLSRLLERTEGRPSQAVQDLVDATLKARGLDFLHFIAAEQGGAAEWPVVKAAFGGVAGTVSEVFSAAQIGNVNRKL